MYVRSNGMHCALISEYHEIVCVYVLRIAALRMQVAGLLTPRQSNDPGSAWSPPGPAAVSFVGSLFHVKVSTRGAAALPHHLNGSFERYPLSRLLPLALLIVLESSILLLVVVYLMMGIYGVL